MDLATEEEKKAWGKALEDLKNSPAAAQLKKLRSHA